MNAPAVEKSIKFLSLKDGKPYRVDADEWVYELDASGAVVEDTYQTFKEYFEHDPETLAQIANKLAGIQEPTVELSVVEDRPADEPADEKPKPAPPKQEISVDVMAHTAVLDAIPERKAEAIVSAKWSAIESKIVPGMLFDCFTEDGQAAVVSEIIRDEFFFMPNEGRNGTFYIRQHTQYFTKDLENLLFFCIRQIARRLHDLIDRFDGDREALRKKVNKMLSASGIDNIIKLLKSDPSMIRMLDEINPAGLVMTPDGALDPLTGEYITKPGAVFTLSTNYAPDLDNEPVEFLKFMRDCFVDDNIEVDEVLNIIGRCLDFYAVALAGKAPQVEKAIIQSGGGGTGKNQLDECMEQIFGTYHMSMLPDSLYETSGGGGDIPRSDLRRTAEGPLIISVKEVAEKKISASVYKTLVSGEAFPVRVQHLADIRDSHSRALLILMANKKPFMPHDAGTIRRTEDHEFKNVYYGTDAMIEDIGLKIAQAEGAQILGLLVNRAIAWNQRGGNLAALTQSKQIEQWTAEYLGWSDVIGRFISDELVKEPGAKIIVSDMNIRFKLWADRNDENQMSGRALGEALSERGIKKKHERDAWKYLGVRFKA